MTREEAIDIIKCLAWHTRPDEEDIEQAIKALEQEPCEDCVSRQAVIDAIDDDNRNGHYSCFATNNDAECFKQIIRDLPSVTPQTKMGHWIDIMVGDMPAQGCDRCNTFYPLAYTGGGHKFCPNCGTRMVEPQEGSDKE